MWLERVLNSGDDRDDWLQARLTVIGASDVKTYSSADKAARYLRAKLEGREFRGNAYTERGHEFEPQLLAATGVPPSSALIHAPGERGFAATPDGITLDGGRLAEAKVRHQRVASGPDRGEWRQLAWQFYCVPEADEVAFVEGELMPSQLGWHLRREPQVTIISRADPRIMDALDTVLPVATRVLALLRVHREMEIENE